jgi:hypothetical protein
MKEGKKLKSILVVMAMLLTALTAVMFGSVSANPGTFDINTPTADAFYKSGTTVNISWDQANASGTIAYNVSIDGTQLTNTSNIYYNWDTTFYDRGAHVISVYAWNWTDYTRTYATSDNISVNITYGTPGYDVWQCGNYSVTGTNNLTQLRTKKVINDTTALKYDETIAIEVNGSLGWAADTEYYLWYPVYTGKHSSLADSANYEIAWKRYFGTEGGDTPEIKNTDIIFGDEQENVPKLNRSGMWIIAPLGAAPNGSTLDLMNATIPAWFWVNATDDHPDEGEFAMSGVPGSFDFGSFGTFDIAVTLGGEETNSNIDVRRSADNKSLWVKNIYDSDGEKSDISKNSTVFQYAGDYEAYAYYDADGGSTAGSQIRYYEGTDYHRYFNYTYGKDIGTWSMADNAAEYNWDICGPWDPPEYCVESQTIEVDTGSPQVVLSNKTLYYGFGGQIDVNVTDAEGIPLTGDETCILIKNEEGTYLTSLTDPLNLTIANPSTGNYTVKFARGMANWSNLHTKADANGSWYVFYVEDADADDTQEWNGTDGSNGRFKVSSQKPTPKLEITNDGHGLATDLKVDVPSTDPLAAGPAKTINIDFKISGDELSGYREYYGDDPVEKAENISVYGDILYAPTTGTLIDNDDGTWRAVVTPTKNGGTITVACDWNISSSTLKKTINIINGTTVTTNVDVIYVGEHTNITVHVADMDGDPIKDSKVRLFWQGGGAINGTTGDGGTGTGAAGDYTFWIQPSDLTAFVFGTKENITIAGNWGTSTNRWGYTMVGVERQHKLKVNCTPTSAYAGNTVDYEIEISLIDGGHPEKTGLTLALLDENGDPVTGDDTNDFPKTNQYDYTGDDALSITLSGGTYTLFAYNDTFDSKENNATIEITKYSIESSPSVLAWLIDTETNVTFTVTPTTNGTLTLNNVSSTPEAAIDGVTPETVDIDDGVGTLLEVNATTLGNITYEFEPTDGEPRSASGMLKVTTANAAPVPSTIYLNEPTDVTITVTHPATLDPIEGVRVGLDHGIALENSTLAKLPDDQFTDANGEVTFGITAETSGNVTIYMQNGTDPDNPFVIKTAVRKTMTLETENPTVNEGATFTVTAKSGGEAITDVTVTVTFDGDTYTTATGVVELEAPTIQETVDYPIKANAEGYTIDAQTTIKVLNLPNLYITVSKTSFKSGETITVKAGADNGNSYGITVTLGDDTKTTAGPDGVTFTAPTVNSDTEYTITATKTGYVDAEEVTITVTPAGIPGFELLTLIAAIGVAFILLRRRRH